MAQMIDADGHIVEPKLLWTEYVEPAYRHLAMQFRRTPAGRDELWVNGENRDDPTINFAASLIPRGLDDPVRAAKINSDDFPAASHDPHARLKVMDDERIDIAVLYPTLWLIYGDITDLKASAAICRAYSNWMADFCKTNPKRLYGVAPMPLREVDLAVQEMRRAVKELGFKAVFIRPNPYGGRRLHDPAYDPFWREAEALDVAVAVHSSYFTHMPTLGEDRYRDVFSYHIVCHPFEQQGACMDVICGGVLEKFPKLRIGFLESGVGWLGYWLDRLDGHYDKMRSFVPWLKKTPTEYFLNNCWISMDPDERTLKAMVELGAERNILWGSDYPHFDCAYPGIVREIEHACEGLAERTRRNIIADNARRFYRLAE